MSESKTVIALGALNRYNILRPQIKPIRKTWAQLKELRDGSRLSPGQVYRIPDYVATTTQADTRSAGHGFDVLVQADDISTLSETAFAVRRDGQGQGRIPFHRHFQGERHLFRNAGKGIRFA